MKQTNKIKEIKIGENVCYFVQTNKYKTFTVGCTFFENLKNKNNEEKVLMCSLMNKMNTTFPNEQLFSNYLKDLYNMSYASYSNRIGLTRMINFVLGTINGQYVNEKEDLIKKAVDLLKDIIFNPYFEEQNLEIEKQLLITDLENTYNNKTQYANTKFLETMFKNELIYTSRVTDKEKVRNVTIDMVKKVYQEMLALPHIFYVIGDIEEEAILSYFKDFTLPSSKEIKLEFIDHETKEFIEPITVVEEIPVNQSILNIGYRSDIYLSDPEYDSMFMFNAMLGHYFHSTLFQVIREEHGLAYYIGSDYNARKGNLAISCAIDGKNYEFTVNLIKEIITDYQNGEISEETLELTKKAIINQIYKAEDDQSTLFTNMLQQYSGMEPSSIEKKIKRINALTISDVCKAANHLKLDTIYLLKGIKNNEKNC